MDHTTIDLLRLIFDKSILTILLRIIITSAMIMIIIISLVQKKNTIIITINQYQVLLEQFKVLSNSFNEAIITKTSKGEVDYCNLNGIRLLHSISKKH